MFSKLCKIGLKFLQIWQRASFHCRLQDYCWVQTSAENLRHFSKKMNSLCPRRMTLIEKRNLSSWSRFLRPDQKINFYRIWTRLGPELDTMVTSVPKSKSTLLSSLWNICTVLLALILLINMSKTCAKV